MKAILEFDLDDNEDKKAHSRAIKSTEAYLVISEILDKLRRGRKYESRDESVLDYIEELEAIIREEMEERAVDIRDLE